MKLPSYLHLNQYGIYYFRTVFPKKVRLHLKKNEFKRSLKTSNRVNAIQIARIFKTNVDSLFNEILNNKMNWLETQAFLNKVADKILKDYNEQVLDRGPYSIAYKYLEAQAEEDSKYFLKMKTFGDVNQIDEDLNRSEGILWNNKDGKISSIASIRHVANSIISQYDLVITDNKIEPFCRQVAEMLWALNIERKKIIRNYRELSPHVWNKDNDLFSILNNIDDSPNNSTTKTQTNEAPNIVDKKQDSHFGAGKILLKQIFKDYIYFTGNTQKLVNGKSIQNYTNKFNFCYDILHYAMNLKADDDIYIEEIQLDNVRKLKHILERIPKRVDIRLKDFSINQICDIITEKQFSADPSIKNVFNDKIGIKTIQNYTIPLRNAVEFAKENLLVTENIFDIFKYKVPLKIKKENQGKPFSVDELNRIFNNPIYSEKKFNRYYKFWIPLILLYSGARRSEICNLKHSDCILIDGIYCFNITDSKTSAGVRTIPIHSKLLDLGILDFIKSRKHINCEYIFDELVETNTNNLRPTSRGNAVSKWFNNASANEYRKGHLDVSNVSGKGKNLHSFRHSFINNLKQQGVEIFIIKQIVGHSTNDITSDVYSEPYNMKVLKSSIERLNYNNNRFPWNINKFYNKITLTIF